MTNYDPIQVLVEHTIPDFYNSLQILFVNYDMIPRFSNETRKQIVIIEGVKTLTDTEHETIRLITKKWKEQTEDIKSKIATNEQEIAQLMSRFVNVLQNPKKIPFALLSKEIIEGITSDLIEQCISEYRVQSDIFDKDKVIRQLNKMEILEPWSQASVCGNCSILELLLSTFPRKDSFCSKCSQKMKTIRIYKFNENYEKIKSLNKDLPEFIKKYIQSKLSNISIDTSYQLGGNNGGDIDVYMPEFKTGYECKLFATPTVEGNSLKSRIGEIIDSFKKYIEKENISRLAAITNLDPKYKQEIEKGIKAGLNRIPLPYSDLKIVCSSTDELMQFLDEEIKYLKSQNLD